MRIQARDVELYVEVFEVAPSISDLPALLGLHGGPGLDGAKLRYELAHLADVARVFVPDQRGHGHSDRGGPESWNLATWAEDVRNLADVLGLARPVVLGTSFGGFVAQKYAATFPGHPAALILISTGPRWLTLEEAVPRFRELGGQSAADAFRRDYEAPDADTSADWERGWTPLLTLREEGRRKLKELQQIRTIEVAMQFMAEGKTMDLRPELGAVRCPTLVLVGEYDPLIPVELATEIVQAIPDGQASLHVIPDAAHNVFMDNPDEAYSQVRAFLTTLRSQA